MRESRKEAVSRHKRELILDAARSVFVEEGLEGASLRAIATRAGYTPAALYFHFDSKEAIYAEVLRQSLASLGQASAPRSRRRAAPNRSCIPLAWLSSVTTRSIHATSISASICSAAA
ncbi:helix-turn-helix domain-containing protein [Bradyrhizobium sp. 26S5]|uniref:helix-turn-helix domain-containing protein n=1 Tax=Bradyrhizobium sp. 26S5 TaxID=3139729 RepID=UPI0030D46D59